MEALGLQDTYVGSSAQALRGILAISQPLRGGTVQDWDSRTPMLAAQHRPCV